LLKTCIAKGAPRLNEMLLVYGLSLQDVLCVEYDDHRHYTYRHYTGPV
jgi:hypothetical protein